MLDDQTKKSVLNVLNYWEIMEFLAQKSIPKSQEQESKSSKITVCDKFSIKSCTMNELLQPNSPIKEKYPVLCEKISFCIGKIERNRIASYLESLNAIEKTPELPCEKGDAITWFSFQTDTNGIYIKGSFKLSPILWAISQWNKAKEKNDNDEQILYLNIEKYNKTIADYDKMIINTEKISQKITLSSFLQYLRQEIQKKYIKEHFPDLPDNNSGLIIYDRYSDEAAKEKNEYQTDYSDLGQSYYLNDITHLCDLISNGEFGDKNEYEKNVIKYILCKQKQSQEQFQKLVSSNSDHKAFSFRIGQRYDSILYFKDILDVKNAPMAKWPSKFMPALMQQVAVNIAIDKNGNAPIFSVNGPPGTGKTTLLKEIVANNIVERAYLIAQNTSDGNPDSLFTQHSFSHGPIKEASYSCYHKSAPYYYSIKEDRINDYGMLVASSNNAAVENITLDLPSRKEFCSEILDLLELDKPDLKGTYTPAPSTSFARYAENLNNKACWGLISAPLGKRPNIKKYCNSVLNPYLKDYKNKDTRDLHKEEYKRARSSFLEQYNLVKAMRDDLQKICDMKDMFLSFSDENSTNIEKQIKFLKSNLKSKQDELVAEKSKKLFFYKCKERQKHIIELEKNIEFLNKELKHCESVIKKEELKKAGKMSLIDDVFVKKYASKDLNESTEAQTTNPWFTAEYNREREKLFIYAYKLHEEFVATSRCMRHNMMNLSIAWGMNNNCQERMNKTDKKAAMPYLIQSLFLFTPVISTTFASIQRLLGDIDDPGILGTLIIDEAGQAQPQLAVGSMFRCRKAIIVGDPKQIEPIVPCETDMLIQLFNSNGLNGYASKENSVQSFADSINTYGRFLGDEDDKEWIGCPLVVHRRSIEPMFTISNTLSYNGTMKFKTSAPNNEETKTFILNESCWINVCGSENSEDKNHYVKAQGDVVMKLLAEKFQKDTSDIPSLFIITPFTSVKNGIKNAIEKSDLYKQESRVEKWVNSKNIGTVHTFQGKEAKEVIFLLGCDENATGAIRWVKKNIVNVAVTRAKYRLYIIGDKSIWTCYPIEVAKENMPAIIESEELDSRLTSVN